jgi:hypothetical protein
VEVSDPEDLKLEGESLEENGGVEGTAGGSGGDNLEFTELADTISV